MKKDQLRNIGACLVILFAVAVVAAPTVSAEDGGEGEPTDQNPDPCIEVQTGPTPGVHVSPMSCVPDT